MVVKITWQEPDDTNVASVAIERSTDREGTFSELATVDATSDSAAKSSSNSWVVSYVDSSGTFNNWYRIRFYDSTNSVWSQYSSPITPRQEIKLTSVDEIKKVIDVVGRYTDDEIFDAIIEIEEDLYVEAGTPIDSVWSYVGKIDSTIQDTYYVGEENIHRVDRVFYGTTTKHEYFLDDGYKANLKYGMVRLLPVASGGPTLAVNEQVEVHYVPRIFNRVALYRTCKYLLERIDYNTRGSPSKELEIINTRLAMVEKRLMNRIGLNLSSDLKNYDPVYGTNRRRVRQNFDRNKYIGSYGWDTNV